MMPAHLAHAVFMNAVRHANPASGLANALQITEWMAARGLRLPDKTWSTVLLKMIEQDYPLDRLIAWIDTSPMGDQNRSMMYVLSNTLRYRRDPDQILPLIKHYVTHDPPKHPTTGSKNDWNESKSHRQERSVLFACLLKPFLASMPRLEQLEEFMSFCRSKQASIGSGLGFDIVSYYLNPSNHQAGASLRDISTRFLGFLRENSDVLKWHSHADLSRLDLVGVGDVPISERVSMESVVQEGLAMVEVQDREVYLFEVYGGQQDPMVLYELAKRRLSLSVTLMDYDLYCAAIFSNVHRHEDAVVGLSKAVEVTGWMVAQGFQLPPKTWGSVLLKMIEVFNPIRQMTSWMDNVPVADLTGSMIYVLSSALDKLHRPKVVLPLVNHYLKHNAVRDRSDEQKVLLQYILTKLVASESSTPLLDEYLSLMNSTGTTATPKTCKSIVAYFAKQAGPSCCDIAKKYPQVLKRSRRSMK